MTKGKIHTGAREYVVDCADYGKLFVNYLYSLWQFVASLRDSKWKIIRGLWYCGKCAAGKDAK